MNRFLFLILGIFFFARSLFAAGDLDGQVVSVSTGDPIASATVDLIRGSQTIVATTTTDINGLYSFIGVSSRQYTVRVSASGFQTAETGARVRNNQTTTVDFALSSNSGDIAGNVINAATMLPIAGATIHVTQHDILIASTITDGSGNYTVGGLPPGSYIVSAEAANYQIGLIGVIVTSDQTTTANFALQDHPGMISGTVTDANTSFPIEGAIIDIIFNDMIVVSTLTDLAGNYSVGDLDPGSYLVEAEADNYETQIQGAIVQANQTTTVNFALGATFGTVSGTVTDAATSLPIQGAIIEVVHNGIILFTEVTDSSGNYIITGVHPNSYVVNARATNYQTAIVGAIVRANQTTIVDFALLSHPGVIAGTVTDSNTGLPILGVSVTLHLDNVPIDIEDTDPDGNYLITGVQPNTYSIIFQAAGYQTMTQEAVVGANQTTIVNVALQTTFGAVNGTITSMVSGLPIAGATIDVLLNHVIIVSDLSDSLGNYEVTGLAPNTYEILADADGYQTAMATISIAPNQTTQQNFSLLSDPSTLQGQLIDALTGNPVVGVFIQIFQNNMFIASTLTDSNGDYLFSTLPSGNFQVILSAADYYTLIQEVSMGIGEIKTMNFALMPNSPPRNLTGQVINNRFLLQTDRIHLIEWQASQDPTVVYYQVFRNGSLVAIVASNMPLRYKDHNVSSKKSDVYSVNAVNASNNQSSFVSITLR